MNKNELVELVDNLVNKQPNSHIINNGDYFKTRISALFEIDQQLYDAQRTDDIVVKYITEAYTVYVNEIAKLIDEYEVRHHDLPERILVMINDFANQLFKSRDPNIVDVEQKKERLQQAQKILHCVGCVLKIGLIEKYIELLSNYKMALNRLDCEGIKKENISYVRYLKNEIKIIKSGHSNVKSSFKMFFDKDKYGVKYNFKNIVTISGLDDLLQKCRNLLLELESNDGIYQHALNSGGKPSIGGKFVDAMLNYIIPGILTMISVILWINNR